MVQFEFKLIFYVVTIQHVSLKAMGMPIFLLKQLKRNHIEHHYIELNDLI